MKEEAGIRVEIGIEDVATRANGVAVGVGTQAKVKTPARWLAYANIGAVIDRGREDFLRCEGI